MKYLEMEHERLEMMQSIKEAREKRSFTMLQLLISLAAIVIVVFLLRDNPTVLVNILYIVGIIIVLWILKGPHEKNPFKRNRKIFCTKKKRWDIIGKRCGECCISFLAKYHNLTEEENDEYRTGKIL